MAIWTLDAAPGEMGGEGQPVLPDGRPEIVVHFGDPFERVDAGAATRQALVLIAGQLDAPLVLRPTGRIAVLGIRLRPAGAPALWRVPQHELVGRTDDARDVSPPVAAWLTEVRDRARSLDDAAAMVGRELERLQVLWWVRAGHRPTVEEGAERLALIRSEGPTAYAFNFGRLFAQPRA